MDSSLRDTLFVFDIDGTLTDSVPMYLMSVTSAMQSLGIVDIDTDYNNYLHHTDSYALRYNYERNFGKKAPGNLLDDFEEKLMQEMSFFDPVKEIKGAKLLIQFLRENKISFCFATGALPKPAIFKLEQCGIWYDEDVLATSKTHESREGFVLDAVKKAKRFYGKKEFGQIISIGDGVWDLKTAQNLSLKFVGIGNKNREKLIAEGAVNCFEDIDAYSKELLVGGILSV